MLCKETARSKRPQRKKDSKKTWQPYSWNGLKQTYKPGHLETEGLILSAGYVKFHFRLVILRNNSSCLCQHFMLKRIGHWLSMHHKSAFMKKLHSLLEIKLLSLIFIAARCFSAPHLQPLFWNKREFKKYEMHAKKIARFCYILISKWHIHFWQISNKMRRFSN